MSWDCPPPCGADNLDEVKFCWECGMPRPSPGYDTGAHDLPAAHSSLNELPSPPGRQGYQLGWTYFVLLGLRARLTWKTLDQSGLPFLGGSGVSNLDRLGSLVDFAYALVTLLAVAKREAWAWYVVLISCAAYLLTAAVWLLRNEQMPLWPLIAVSLTLVAQVLWFGYFYKRRAMFGARGRWRWLESQIPAVVGPEELPPKLGLNDHALAHRRRVALALFLMLGLIIVYQGFFAPKREPADHAESENLPPGTWILWGETETPAGSDPFWNAIEETATLAACRDRIAPRIRRIGRETETKGVMTRTTGTTIEWISRQNPSQRIMVTRYKCLPGTVHPKSVR